jgi:hypothetical protein
LINNQEDNALFISFIPFSNVIIEKLSGISENDKKQRLFKEIIADNSFEILYKENNGKTLIHPMHKGGKSRQWSETLQMDKDLNKVGIDVIFLPEHVNISNADVITVFYGRYVFADFKYSASTNAHTIYKNLVKGFNQANTIVLKLERGDVGTLRKAIEELKRKKGKIGNFIFINKYGLLIEIDYKKILDNTYINKIRGFF